MKKYRIEDMIGGWFIGDFSPSVLQTKEFEVCYKVHPKGEKWDTHFHKEATEINYLIEGKMKVCGDIILPGDIFVIDPFEVSAPEFLEDCKLIVVKIPSVIGDKYKWTV